jgi:hypothetical protein
MGLFSCSVSLPHKGGDLFYDLSMGESFPLSTPLAGLGVRFPPRINHEKNEGLPPMSLEKGPMALRCGGVGNKPFDALYEKPPYGPRDRTLHHPDKQEKTPYTQETEASSLDAERERRRAWMTQGVSDTDANVGRR